VIAMDNKTYHLYTDEEKLEIIKDHEENNLSIRACATKYNIAKTSLVM
jgi:transposase-like protein